MPYSYTCSLVRVIDGDTVVLSIDLGFRLTATLPIRLVGIDAPEMDTQAGRTAKQWVIDWFVENPAITVLTLKDPEKYGRWLGIVLPFSATPVSLNSAILQAGIARPYDGHGSRS